ncbi:hypothetical protein SAMN05216474_0944 [Lishizhenia tianjinensis]|uniref:Uncharacterized protein n=1 Tax=Lishizhenia tianjinensis TaxID=477690 RepID=A0A1I6YJB4_9FLAO|nr:hypothetical protein [Lishizhenia tianjinensis]SFT50573.1 hypothetical protein SAMN05216474_0944 [Lishizhenia tianjinensis]
MKKLITLSLSSLLLGMSSLNAQTKTVLNTNFEKSEKQDVLKGEYFAVINGYSFEHIENGSINKLVKKQNGKNVESIKLPGKTDLYKRYDAWSTFKQFGKYLVEVLDWENNKTDKQDYILTFYDENLIEKKVIPVAKLTSDWEKRDFHTEVINEYLFIKTVEQKGGGNNSIGIKVIGNDLELKKLDQYTVAGKVSIQKVKIENDILSFIQMVKNTNGQILELKYIGYNLKDNQKTSVNLDFSALKEGVSDFDYRLDDNTLKIHGYTLDDYESFQFGKVFSIAIDINTENVLHTNTSEKISGDAKEMYTAFDLLKQGKVNEGRYFSYRQLNTWKLEDGSTITLGEHYNYYETVDKSSYDYYKPHHLHADLIISKFNEAGEVEWMKTVPRNTRSTQLKDTEIFSHLNNEEVSLVYESNGDFMLTKLDLSSENIETELIFNKKEHKSKTNFGVYTQLSEDEFALSIYDLKNHNVLMVAF